MICRDVTTIYLRILTQIPFSINYCRFYYFIASTDAPLTPPATPPPTIPRPDPPLRLKDIACRERLGEVLKHYYRRAAVLPAGDSAVQWLH